ncbi:MAG: M23 family metallopeptidase [Thermoleophilia bacterium]|nr:M23 family metallopeptidase [Thermoleophilia bacterium]
MASEPHTLQPRASTRHRYRWHSAAFLAVMFALAMLALAAIIASSRASSSPLLDEQTMSASRGMASVREPAAILLATTDEVELMLPVYEEQVTTIGYHPVDDDNVLSLVPNGYQLNDSFLGSLSGITGSEGPGYFMMGDSSKAVTGTGAIDVGAPAGTTVFSPVDGTVAGIRAYHVKGTCPDTEVKIKPLSQSNTMVVMTHLGNIQATLGQPVKAGITKIGAVRQLDGCLEQNLGSYTYDSGNHLHMQVEAINDTRVKP